MPRRKGTRKTELGNCQWCPVSGQKVISKNWNKRDLTEGQEAHLHYMGDRALAPFAQRGCGASVLESFKSHLNMILSNLFCLSRWDQMTSRGSFQQDFLWFCDSVILCNIFSSPFLVLCLLFLS